MARPRAPMRITTGFAFSYINRAILEGLADRRFGVREMDAALEFFGGESAGCAYCGGQPIARWDHLVPVKNGGETVLGNMVPACARCDDSKRDLPFDSWMSSATNHSPTSRGVPDVCERIDKLRAYAPHFGYSPRKPEEGLRPEQRERLHELREKLQGIREELEYFLASIDKEPE